MLLVLLALVFIAVCVAVLQLVALRRQVSSIRQFLEWTAVGFLEKSDQNPEQREYLERVKEDLMREGKVSKRQVDIWRR